MNIKKILYNTILKDLYVLLTAPTEGTIESIKDKKAEVRSEDHFTGYILNNLIVGETKGGKYVTRTTR